MSLGGVSPLAGLPARRVRWQRGSRCGAVRSHDLPQVRAAAAPGPPLSPPRPLSLPAGLGVGAGVEALPPRMKRILPSPAPVPRAVALQCAVLRGWSCGMVGANLPTCFGAALRGGSLQ